MRGLDVTNSKFPQRQIISHRIITIKEMKKKYYVSQVSKVLNDLLSLCYHAAKVFLAWVLRSSNLHSNRKTGFGLSIDVIYSSTSTYEHNLFQPIARKSNCS